MQPPGADSILALQLQYILQTAEGARPQRHPARAVARIAGRGAEVIVVVEQVEPYAVDYC